MIQSVEAEIKENSSDQGLNGNYGGLSSMNEPAVGQSSGVDGSSEMQLRPLPLLSFESVNRTIVVNDFNVEVTSLDIAAHGRFVAAGCTNGMVLLFDLADDSEMCSGRILGHIRAKGLHTNLILTVQFSDDCRFLFAGVLKGSSELLAIDIGKLHVATSSARYTTDDFEQKVASSIYVTPAVKANRKEAVARASTGIGSIHSLHRRHSPRVQVHSHSDPKLRGFGAVARVCSVGDGPRRTTTQMAEYAHEPEYRLACGKGIKNVHVWQFMPGLRATRSGSTSSSLRNGSAQKAAAAAAAAAAATAVASKEELDGVFASAETANSDNKANNTSVVKWVHLYDVAGNGNTITHISFRKGGMAMLSKSNGMNLRVWNLNGSRSQAEDGSVVEAAPVKPTYEDVANSADVRCLLSSGFAYGGTYEFAVLRVDAPREANRDALELPERVGGEDGAADSSAGLRRRRTMREIEDVMGSDDGAHVLVMCTDGGVMYHRGESNGRADNATGSSFSSSSSSSSSSAKKGLLELPALQRDKELDQCMVMRRVGRDGHVVVLRASRTGATIGIGSAGGGSGGANTGMGTESGNATPGSAGSGVSIPGFLAPQIDPLTSTISIQLLDVVSSGIESTAILEDKPGEVMSSAVSVASGWGDSGGGFYYHDSDSGDSVNLSQSEDDEIDDIDDGEAGTADGFARRKNGAKPTEELNGSSGRKKKSRTSESVEESGSANKQRRVESAVGQTPAGKMSSVERGVSGGSSKRRKVTTFEDETVARKEAVEDESEQLSRLASASSSPVAGTIDGVAAGSIKKKDRRRIEGQDSKSAVVTGSGPNRSRRQQLEQQASGSVEAVSSKPLSRGLFRGGRDEEDAPLLNGSSTGSSRRNNSGSADMGGLFSASAAPVVLGPAPRIKRLSTTVGKQRPPPVHCNSNTPPYLLLDKLSTAVLSIFSRFVSLTLLHLSMPNGVDPLLAPHTAVNGTRQALQSELGPCALTNLSAITLEQDRLRGSFVAELIFGIKNQLQSSITEFKISPAYKALAVVGGDADVIHTLFSAWLSFYRIYQARDRGVACILVRYESVVADMVQRQQMELDGSGAADLVNASTCPGIGDAPSIKPLGGICRPDPVRMMPTLQYRHRPFHEWVIFTMRNEFLSILDQTLASGFPV